MVLNLALCCCIVTRVFLVLDVDVVARADCVTTWYYLAVLARGLWLADVIRIEYNEEELSAGINFYYLLNVLYFGLKYNTTAKF